jgi:separase
MLNTDSSEHSLAVTEDLCRQSLELTSLATKTSLLHKIQINRLLSNALYSFSLLKLESGHAGSALSYAKRCVKLLQRNWALLENAFKPQQRIAVDAVTDSDLELSVDANGEKSSMRHIRVVVALSTTHDALNGSQFWSLVPSLRRSYYHLSTMFAHHGLFSESIYWVEQAQKIAQALGSPSPLLRNFSVLAGYWIKADQVEKGQSFLDQALDSGMVNRPSLDLVQHQLSVAYMWKARLEPDDAVEALDSALETIQRLTDISLINSLDRFAISEGSIVAELAGMHIEDSVPPAKTTRKGRSLKKPAPKTVPKTTRKTKPKTTAEPTCRDGLECVPLLAIRADIFRKKSFELLLKDKITIASDVVDQAEDFQTVQSAVISQQIAKFRKLFHQVLKAVASDCAFSVLPDSTVSIPATSLAEYRQSDQSLGRSPLSSSPKDTITRPSPGRKIIKSRPVSKKQDFKILLRVATDCLADVHFSAMQTCSMDVIHQLCGLLAGAAVYLSAMNQHYKSLTHPMHTALLLG